MTFRVLHYDFRRDAFTVERVEPWYRKWRGEPIAAWPHSMLPGPLLQVGTVIHLPGGE
jgi:hypothetical protein